MVMSAVQRASRRLRVHLPTTTAPHAPSFASPRVLPAKGLSAGVRSSQRGSPVIASMPGRGGLIFSLACGARGAGGGGRGGEGGGGAASSRGLWGGRPFTKPPPPPL